MHENLIDYNGALSRSYEQGRVLSPEALRTWHAAVEALVPPSDPVIDVGAGTGRFARQLAGLTDGSVVAVEPASGMRRNAPVADHRNLSWMAGTAEDLPLRTASAGLIWSAFTTHYLHLGRSAVEFNRVLRPGGRVLIWHAFPDVFDQLEWFRWFPSARLIDEARMPAASEVRETLENAGLRFVERSVHHMHIADSLMALADRLSHRSISTLRLVSDDEFRVGLEALRTHARDIDTDGPVLTPNVLLVFER